VNLARRGNLPGAEGLVCYILRLVGDGIGVLYTSSSLCGPGFVRYISHCTLGLVSLILVVLSVLL